VAARMRDSRVGRRFDHVDNVKLPQDLNLVQAGGTTRSQGRLPDSVKRLLERRGNDSALDVVDELFSVSAETFNVDDERR